ncbi:MAG: bactofilin family protein [Hyphomicrobiaceae bacterium]
MFSKKPEIDGRPGPELHHGNYQGQVSQNALVSVGVPKSNNGRSPSNSVIDEWLTMTGDLESDGDIMVKGAVHGNIRCKLLIVDENASVEGAITVDELFVRGATLGVIRATRVVIEKTACVNSEIHHRTVAIEEGAIIKGALCYDESASDVDQLVKATAALDQPAAMSRNSRLKDRLETAGKPFESNDAVLPINQNVDAFLKN